jgi:tRNA threonylcarbamoyladenosine biosynthesis protein TsaE
VLTGSWVTKGAEETFAYARKAGEGSRPGEVWCLSGDLGAGKTAFVQGLAAGLGFEGRVTSPTFALQNVYEGRLTLHHFDWYRLGRADEVRDLGWEEWLSKGAVVAVEWGDRFPELFPEGALALQFEVVGEDERRLILTASGREAEDRAEGLIRCWPP